MLDAPIRGGRSLVLSRLALLFALVAALLASLARPSDSRKPQEFKEGIQAQDREEWAKSAELMSRAASVERDDGAITRIYGNRLEPYLPLYFWGLALYKQEKCPEALAEWEQSLQAGAVQRTEKQKLLLRYREDCRSRTAALTGRSPLREAPAGPSDQLRKLQRLQADRP
jgi:hypothetical protein